MHRVQMTVDGDKLDYPYEIPSTSAALLETKLIVKITISDHKRYG